MKFKDFTDFTEAVRDEVAKRAGAGFGVAIKDVRKNNGIVMRGVSLEKEGSNISPVIYIDGYYESYRNGTKALADVADDVMDVYRRNKTSRNVDMRHLLDYGRVEENIVYKLINTERNRELLEDVPHMEFLDLSVVYQCMIENEEIGRASVLIHNGHMKLWGVSQENLHAAAEGNTQKLQGYEIRAMSDIICGMMARQEDAGPEAGICSSGSECSGMYVLSSRSKVDGAACMLYPDLLRDFAETLGSSVYIIPSSVHELLLMPSDGEDSAAELKEIIKDVNDTQLLQEEVLSYSLYRYDRESGEISIV